MRPPDRVEALPFIATAQVRRHWPDGVQIAVTERVPVVQMAGPGTGLVRARRPRPDPGRSSRAGRPGWWSTSSTRPSAGIPPAPVGRLVAAVGRPGPEVCRTLPPAFAAQVVSVTVAADGTVSLALTRASPSCSAPTPTCTAKYEDVAAIIAHASLDATSPST